MWQISIAMENVITYSLTRARASLLSGICPELHLLAAPMVRLSPAGWSLIGTADFNGDGKPDYLLYRASTAQTAIWYMNNNVFLRRCFWSDSSAGWNLVAP